MKIHSILALGAAMAVSFAAHAHDCSGGSAGGMDATGNQCNDEAAYASLSIAHMPAASPAMQLDSGHTLKQVASTHAKSGARHTSKSYSHRASKRPPATAG